MLFRSYMGMLSVCKPGYMGMLPVCRRGYMGMLSVCRRGYMGMLSVHMAAMNGYFDCFKKLVAIMPTFEVDTIDDLGRTCLHAAACSGYLKLFSFFS